MTTVVFSHGQESGPWGTKIRAMADRVRDKGCDAVSIDYQGIADPTARVDKLIAEAGKLADRLVLVGSSMGGHVATAAAERVGASGALARAAWRGGLQEEGVDWRLGAWRGVAGPAGLPDEVRVGLEYGVLPDHHVRADVRRSRVDDRHAVEHVLAVDAAAHGRFRLRQVNAGVDAQQFVGVLHSCLRLRQPSQILLPAAGSREGAPG